MKQIIAILCILLLSACAQPQSDTIKIGGLFGLSGISAAFGEDELRGATLAIEEINTAGGINGKQFEFIVEDGQTTVAGNLNGYRKLVDVNTVKYVIGPTWDASAHSIVPFLREDEVILISPSSGEGDVVEFNHPLFFKTYPPYKEETKIMIKHMQDNGIKQIIIVASQGSFEDAMVQGFQGYNKKITILNEERLQFSEKDFRSVLTKIQQEKPDAIYLVLGDYAAIGEFFEQTKAVGVKIPIYTYSGAEQQNLLADYPQAIEGMLYPKSARSEKDIAFNEKFKVKYGNEPNTPAAATAYDAVKMLAIGLEKANSVEEVSVAMHSISNYEGASPINGFDANGWPETGREYVMKTVQNGQFALIS